MGQSATTKGLDVANGPYNAQFALLAGSAMLLSGGTRESYIIG